MNFNNFTNKFPVHLYCSIRIPHLNRNNKSLYHFIEHLIYYGLRIPELGIYSGLQNTNFIYSATAFTDKSSINICFVCSTRKKTQVIKLFESLEQRKFDIVFDIFNEQRDYILEEIANRKEDSFFSWRDKILEETLKGSQLGYNEIGVLNDVNSITVYDIRDYLYDKNLKFNFYYSIGEKEKYCIKSETVFLWEKNQENVILHSSKDRKLSIVCVVPTFTKEDYIWSQIFSDYFLNVNDSVITKHLISYFDTYDVHLESEIYDNCIIFHFTAKYGKNVDKNELLNYVKNCFEINHEIDINKVKKIILKLKCLLEFNSYRRLYSSYLRLFKLQNKHYLLSKKDYNLIDIEKFCIKLKKEFQLTREIILID